jgi:hypothetical protein
MIGKPGGARRRIRRTKFDRLKRNRVRRLEEGSRRRSLCGLVRHRQHALDEPGETHRELIDLDR